MSLEQHWWDLSQILHNGGTKGVIRIAHLNQAHVFVGDQTGSRRSTASLTDIKGGPREGVSSGTFGDMRTLCKAAQLKEALHIFNQPGIRADSKTCVRILQECGKTKDLAEGKRVHAHIVNSGLKQSIFLLNTLVNMYAKCGSVVDARQVFDKMPHRDTFTWNMMITGYCKHGCGREALNMYEQMQQEKVVPDRVTFTCILNACGCLGAQERGKEIHADIMKAGIVSDVILETALADMYSKCGNMKDAQQVFDSMAKRNVVSWNAMITGYAQHGCGREALGVYEQMQKEGFLPNSVTFTCILYACASLGALEKGKEVHTDIVKAGILQDMVLETALLDMYVKCGSMGNARQVFDKMGQRDVVSWNALIAGYSEHGGGREAFKMYEQMQQKVVIPDTVTFICLLNVCASLGALEKGKEIHAHIIKAGIPSCMNLHTALADMYAKCGSMKDAHQLFLNMAKRDVVSWNAMIAGCAQHGCGREACHLFEQMQQEGLRPDLTTFLSLLSACSHVGLVDEGHHYFDSMSRDHGLTPTADHFGCVVDLLGRSGRLDEAEDFIKKLQFKPDAGVWRALLGACRIHGKVEVAERAAKSIIQSNPQDAAAYVLLSNIYAAAARWDDRAQCVPAKFMAL